MKIVLSVYLYLFIMKNLYQFLVYVNSADVFFSQIHMAYC